MFNDILQGRTPIVQFIINGILYNMGYYLAYDINPDWTTFVKTIPMPQEDKRKIFLKCQEGGKKECEKNIWCAQISISSYM